MPQSTASYQLIDLFCLQQFGWIYKSNAQESSTWLTETEYPLTHGAFINLHQDPTILIGTRFQGETKHLLDDIDRGSKYHPANDLLAFHNHLNQLEDLGLIDPIIAQSSDSGGIHIYYFFDRPVPTFALAAAVRQFLTERNFTVADGQIEIYPNPKAYNKPGETPTAFKGHRLPAQPNSGWMMLDRDGDILPCEFESLNYEGQLSSFVNCAQNSQQDMELLDRQIAKYHKRYLASQKNSYYAGGGDRVDGLSAKAAAWKADLLKTIEIGFTGHGQTNRILPEILKYVVVFERIEDLQEQHQRVKEIVVNCPGYREYCRHQHEIDRRISDWLKINARIEKYTAYCSYPRRSDLGDHRASPKSTVRQDEVKNRLIATVAAVKEELGGLPDRIGQLIDALQNKSRQMFDIGFGKNTLNNREYKPLWHPKFNQEVEAETTENRPEAESLTEQAIPQLVLKDITQSTRVTTLSLRALSHLLSLYVVFVIMGLPAARSPEVAAIIPVENVISEDSKLDQSKKETLPSLAVREELDNQGLLIASEESSLNSTSLDSAQEFDQNEQNQQSISKDYGISPRARSEKAISQDYQSPPSGGGLAAAPGEDEDPDTPIPGMRVYRKHHVYGGKEYPEIFGVVVDSDGLRSSVLTDLQQQFCVSDAAWLSTWFPAPS
jgi:hypothetical protein